MFIYATSARGRMIVLTSVIVLGIIIIVVISMQRKHVHRYSHSVLDKGEMGDSGVVTTLREKYLVLPSTRDTPYNLEHPEIVDPSVGQAFFINRILGGKRNGFFVECGAYDGETMSNTLMFERDYNWTGLLIEPSPPYYTKLLTKKRKAYLSPTCLSRSTSRETVEFVNNNVGSHIVRSREELESTDTVDVHCFPLYSYLLALNQQTVDYFSLDVEGNELEVLRSIPWDLVDIRTLTVEYFILTEGKAALRSYMESVGYYQHSEIQIRPDHGADDLIFVKNGIDF